MNRYFFPDIIYGWLVTTVSDTFYNLYSVFVDGVPSAMERHRTAFHVSFFIDCTCYQDICMQKSIFAKKLKWKSILIEYLTVWIGSFEYVLLRRLFDVLCKLSIF